MLPVDRRPAGNIGFCASWADGITMSICNSVWHLFGQTSFNLAFVFIFIISFSIGLRFRADVFQIPQHRKALFVVRHLGQTLTILMACVFGFPLVLTLAETLNKTVI